MARLCRITTTLFLFCFCVYFYSLWHARQTASRYTNSLSIELPYFENKPLKTILNFNTRDYRLFQNHSDAFFEELYKKYGDIRVFDLKSVNTALTLTEKQNIEKCIGNGPSDKRKSDSTFWNKHELIRRTHHDYLRKDGAVLIEVGGNKGNDATEFVRLYNPRYIILEPLEEYAVILKKTFENNTRVSIINLGLGFKNEIVMVTTEGNNACATSKFHASSKNRSTMVPLYLANTTELLTKIGVGVFEVDLFTLNCEGCEFEALEALTSSNLIGSFRNIQFATHSTIPGINNTIPRYCRIQELLSRTHRPTYQYRLIWENWRRIINYNSPRARDLWILGRTGKSCILKVLQA